MGTLERGGIERAQEHMFNIGGGQAIVPRASSLANNNFFDGDFENDGNNPMDFSAILTSNVMNGDVMESSAELGNVMGEI